MKKFFMISFLLILSLFFSNNINAADEGENEPDTNLCAKKFAHMEAGQSFSIALSDEGKVYTWGLNNNGQLGLGYTNDYGEGINRVTPVAALDGVKIKAVSAGNYHALALSEDGNVYSWGGNTSGVLGYGNSDYDFNQTSPKQVPGLKNIVSIEAGADLSYAIDATGQVYSWGDGTQGALGYTDYDSRWGQTSPKLISYFNENNIKIKQSENGTDYTMFITEDGSLYVVGYMHNISERNKPPLLIGSDVEFTDVSASVHGQVLLIGTDKKVYFLGKNYKYLSGIPTGQSNGSEVVFDTPTIIPGLQDYDFMDVSISSSYPATPSQNGAGIALAISTDNIVYGWGGNNSTGQYGIIGSGLYREDPDQLPEVVQDYKLTSVSAGLGFVLALNADGSSFSWGLNDEGQLGLGTTTKSPKPASVIGDVRCPIDFEKSYYEVSSKYAAADGVASVDLDVVLINEDGGFTTSIFPGALTKPTIDNLTFSDFVFDEDNNKYTSKITSTVEGDYPIDSVTLENQTLEYQNNKVAHFGVAQEVEPTTPEVTNPDGTIDYPIDANLVMNYDFECGTEFNKDMFAIKKQEGIIFTTTIEDGKLIVTASAGSGYEIKDGSTTEWSIQLPEVKPCDIEVDYLSVKANGTSEEVKSTILTLEFSKEITDLSINDITVTTKTKSNNNYILSDLKYLGDGTYEVAINGDWDNGTEVNVNVSKTGYVFNVDFNSVTLFNVTEDGGNNGNENGNNGNGNNGNEGNTNGTRPVPETGSETMLMALVAITSGAVALIIRKKLIS